MKRGLMTKCYTTNANGVSSCFKWNNDRCHTYLIGLEFHLGQLNEFLMMNPRVMKDHITRD